MSSQQLKLEIKRREPWFHNLHLPDGTETCPDHSLGDFPSVKWRPVASCLPTDLSDWTALDIGCNAGFYSFELARRGARVTAIDLDEHYLEQARWAAGHFNLQDRIEFRRQHLYELARGGERWDLVLFLGVFYHLRYPLLGLDIVSRAVGKLLVFQSMTMPGSDVEQAPLDFPLSDRERLTRSGWPKMAFIERDLAGDCTNWWAPNHACIQAMLRSTGLRVIAEPGHEMYVCTPDPKTPSSMWPWNEDEYRAAIGNFSGESSDVPTERGNGEQR